MRTKHPSSLEMNLDSSSNTTRPYRGARACVNMDALGTGIANSVVPLMILYCTSPNSLHCHWDLIFTPRIKHLQQYHVMINKDMSTSGPDYMIRQRSRTNSVD